MIGSDPTSRAGDEAKLVLRTCDELRPYVKAPESLISESDDGRRSEVRGRSLRPSPASVSERTQRDAAVSLAHNCAAPAAGLRLLHDFWCICRPDYCPALPQRAGSLAGRNGPLTIHGSELDGESKEANRK